MIVPSWVQDERRELDRKLKAHEMTIDEHMKKRKELAEQWQDQVDEVKKWP